MSKKLSGPCLRYFYLNQKDLITKGSFLKNSSFLTLLEKLSARSSFFLRKVVCIKPFTPKVIKLYPLFIYNSKALLRTTFRKGGRSWIDIYNPIFKFKNPLYMGCPDNTTSLSFKPNLEISSLVLK